jgi:hypothetical protein
MTRIKLLAISTTAALMIFGSSLAVAVTPEADSTDTTTADPVSVTTDFAAADPRPAKRGGGGSGKALKK